MYYIVNQTDHIIAADNELLQALSVSTLHDLQKDIALGIIEFTSPFRPELRISISGTTKVYSSDNHTLSSLLGDMILVEIKEELQEEKTESEALDFISIKDESESVEKEIFEIHKPEDQTLDTADETLEDTPLELFSDDILEVSEEAIIKETAPIRIDIQKISQLIGITPKDYDRFLKEYIDTALTLEDDLKGNKEKQRSQAIDTLGHLSQVLHLSTVFPIIEQIKEADDNTRSTYITSFYDTLSKVVITDETTPLETETVKTPTDQSFGTIDLSSVKPIHFDFQMEAAANDLSLPLELIEEFVIDFIDQAHIETEKMLEAYQNGDLDRVQKIGHLLKGTSSNLRIKPLANTLHNIQFCEESTELEDLIKTYWGHFLSFENQINITLKRI